MVFLCQIRNVLEGARKISKTKGVEICGNLMFAGAKRKEIVLECTTKYGISISAVEKWILAARPIVAERQKEAERIRAEEDKAATIESAKRLNITQDRIAEQYAKMAFYDPEAELKEIFARRQGGNPDDKDEEMILSYGKLLGIKASDVKGALDSLCKLFGFNAPDKSDVTAHVTTEVDYSKYTDDELRLLESLANKGRVGETKSA